MINIMKDLAKIEFTHGDNNKNATTENKLKILEFIKQKSVSSLQEIVKHNKTVHDSNFAKKEIEKSYEEMCKVLETTSKQQYLYIF